MEENLRRHSTAARKAAAVAEVEELVKAGKPVRAAVEDVAYRTGLGERTIFSFLQKTKGLPREEWEVSLARKREIPRPRVICHPAALKRFLDLCRSGRHATVSYRQTLVEAAENGWAPIPGLRTMQRELHRHSSQSDLWLARRKGDV